MQAYHMAELYAHLGDDDRAFESLNRSWEKREAVMLDIKISADFQRLHNDPRYKALLKKVKVAGMMALRSYSGLIYSLPK